MNSYSSLYTNKMEKLGPLGQALECAVCLEVLNASSRVLPCQHTFCESCLCDIVNSQKELRCPECRVLVTVPLEDLPPNILLMRVLESIKKLPQPDPENVSKTTPTHCANESASSRKSPLISCAATNESLGIRSLNQQTLPVTREPAITQNTSIANINCQEEIRMPRMAHDFFNDSPAITSSNPFVSLEPTVDRNSLDRSAELDFFPTDFSASAICSSDVTNTASKGAEIGDSNIFTSTPRRVSRDTSSDFNSSAFSSISTSQGGSLAPTNAALMRPGDPLFVQMFDENRRKSINLPTTISNPTEGRSSLSATFSNKNNGSMNTLATALYPYSQKEFWDLSFKKGDVITIMQKVDENWYQGKLNGQVGFLPSSYVQVQQPPTNFPQCVALFDFKITAESMKGLSFQKGDVITVLRRVDENWAEGKLNAEIGIFPLSFVEVNEAAKSLLNSPPQNVTEKQTPERITPANRTSVSNRGTTTNLIDIGPKPSNHNTQEESQDNLYECIHPYNPSKGDELQLNKGSFYSVTEKCKDGWFKGRCLLTDKVGVFPGNYVSLSSDDKVEANLSSQEKENSKNITIKEKICKNLCLVHEINNCTLSPNHPKSPAKYSLSFNDSAEGPLNIFQKTEIIPRNRSGKYNIGKIDKNCIGTETRIFRQPVPLMRERYRCSVPYPPNNPDEVELQQGDVVYVHRKMDDGWFKGTLLRTGETGLFPSTFVDPY